MALFDNSRALDALRSQNQQLLIIIADLRDELASERESARKERESLLNKLVALSNPPAYRVMNPVPMPERSTPMVQRPHVPGVWPPPPRINPQEQAVAEALVDKVAKGNGQ